MKGLKKDCAEFIGTFVLVLIACGVAVKSGCEGPAGVLLTAAAFGGKPPGEPRPKRLTAGAISGHPAPKRG